jgi:hypothetical protein
MQRMRTFAAGLTLAVSLGAGATALAPAASATPNVPTTTGSFRTWHSAQHAAGFNLMKPAKTYGLQRGPILVQRCLVTGKLNKRQVIAGYGNPSHKLLAIYQTNANTPCGNFGEAKKLGHYQVHGRRATLWGACGMPGEHSCHSRKIVLYLVWKKSGKYYQASSFNEKRGTLVSFARHLRHV